MSGGDKQSLTQQLNVVRKLRDMGATSIQVGDIIAHFNDPSNTQYAIEEAPEDAGLVDDTHALTATQRWFRNGGD